MTDNLASSGAVEAVTARRNAFLLAGAAAFSGAGLTGQYLLDADKSLATLPVSIFTVGIAAGTIPAAMLMRQIGRRLGFMAGAGIGIAGGIAAGFAVLADSFVLFTIAAAVIGFAGAFAQQYRFAAADNGSAEFRAKAISWVLAGGVAAAIIGPQTVIFTRDLFAPIPFAGAFFATSVLAAIALMVLSFLGGSARIAPKSTERSGGRPLGEIVRQPRFVVAIVCAIGSYALMSLLMTAAPLAMVGCGLGQDNAALGIQWHVMAMFGPSFFTGSLIARFGKEAIIGAGMALLALCAVIALMGIELANFWLALILLGIGWNFGFIGATAMLTETYASEESAKVQGLNDFLVFGSVAVASFSSGKLYAAVGWETLAIFAFPIVAICSLALVFSVMARRKEAA